MTNEIKALSDLTRSDLAHIGAHLSDYVAQVKQSAGREVRTWYENTLVFIAARDTAKSAGDKFQQGEFALSCGYGKSTASGWALLALAVEKGIDPDGSERDNARWAYMTQHRNADVRSALSAPNARTLLDTLIKGGKLPDTDDDTDDGADDDTDKREAQPNEGESFASVVTSIRTAADMLALTDDDTAQVATPRRGDLARLESAIADLSAAHAAWSEKVRESETPTTVGRGRGAVAVVG